MITIPVNASKKYNIYIEDGLLAKAGQLIRNDAGGQKAFLVTDSNVDMYHSEAACKSLELGGYEVFRFVLPAGEKSKTLQNVSEILSAMAAAHLSRKDVAIALGGGVVGDITGFTASMYMRGISYVQIPTTVLAAVDSSVGGKTAVDLPEGKNLAGAFYQPSAVIFDSLLLNTLPRRDYNNGFAEIIKYGMIADAGLFDMLREKPLNINEIVRKCVEIKAEIVAEDEFESGRRQILNFGHSIGHAYESLSDYELLHGEAVSCGMIKICEIAAGTGMCSDECTEILTEALNKFSLPLHADHSVEETVSMIKMDKKVSGDSINLIMPVKPGEVTVKKTELRELDALLKLRGI